MQSSIRVSVASRTAARTSVRCNAVKPDVCLLLLLFECTRRVSANQTHNSFASYLLHVQVPAVPRREVLASGAAIAASLLAVASAQAAGESSATRAITNVTRPM